jgi:hypothetical protein
VSYEKKVFREEGISVEPPFSLGGHEGASSPHKSRLPSIPASVKTFLFRLRLHEVVGRPPHGAYIAVYELSVN